MTSEGAVQDLADLVATHYGTDAKLGLYKSSYTPGPNAVYADLAANEADFVGYARAALTFGPVGTDVNGIARTLSDNALFTAGALVGANTLGGAFLTIEDAGPPVINKVVRFFPFPLPVSVQTDGQQIGFKVAITAPDLNGHGVAET